MLNNEVHKLSGQLLLDTAGRLPNLLKRRYLDFLDNQSINQFIFGEITVEQYHQIEETKQKQTTGEKKYIRIIFINKYYAHKRSKVRKKGAQHATVIPRETAK